ncbi:hypothetical protein CK203_104126 [Vitis vinifera]|uniref:Uncharacterized protein n=1 Tax=Vitis vinifera TaxID=29760 RepID=A0A438FIB6_VITVI|nr:hypothetical protein CK203_104126 [Vitis vinifera]
MLHMISPQSWKDWASSGLTLNVLNRSTIQNGMPEFDNPDGTGDEIGVAFGEGIGEGTGEGIGICTGEGFGDFSGDCSVKSIGSELSTLAFSSMADHLTWLNIALPAALVAPASLEEGLVSTAKALEQVLEQNLDLAPFADSFCGSKGMKICPSRSCHFGLSIFGRRC